VRDDEFSFKGDDFSAGAALGIIWTPHPQWSLGANYKSRSTMNYGGQSVIWPYAPEAETSLELSFPQSFALGLSYRPSGNWNLEFNADWTDWSAVGVLEFDRASADRLDLPLNWRSSWFYQFGITRVLPQGYNLSA
jgi:long-chain fatty acid transport protein